MILLSSTWKILVRLIQNCFSPNKITKPARATVFARYQCHTYFLQKRVYVPLPSAQRSPFVCNAFCVRINLSTLEEEERHDQFTIGRVNLQSFDFPKSVSYSGMKLRNGWIRWQIPRRNRRGSEQCLAVLRYFFCIQTYMIPSALAVIARIISKPSISAHTFSTKENIAYAQNHQFKRGRMFDCPTFRLFINSSLSK